MLLLDSTNIDLTRLNPIVYLQKKNNNKLLNISKSKSIHKFTDLLHKYFKYNHTLLYYNIHIYIVDSSCAAKLYFNSRCTMIKVVLIFSRSVNHTWRIGQRYGYKTGTYLLKMQYKWSL